MTTETLEQGLLRLETLEVQARGQAIELCLQDSSLRLRDALDGCRWAAMWIDDLLDLIAECCSAEPTDLKGLIDRAYESSLARCDSIEASLVFRPVIQAFCGYFGKDAEKMRQLLESEV